MRKKYPLVSALFHLCIFIFFSFQIIAQVKNTPYYNFKTFTTNDGLVSNNVNCVLVDSKSFLWVGTDRGAQRFNGSAFQTFRHVNDNRASIINDNVYCILEDRQHDIWFGTTQGISRFSYKNGRFYNYELATNKKLSEKIVDVYWLFQDSQQRLWAGSRTGLFLLDTISNQFKNHPPKNIPGITDDHFIRVGCIKENDQQELIFTVVDGFVIMDKQGNQKYYTVPEPTIKPVNHLPVGQVFILKEYPDEIWVTPNLNGLFKYQRSTGEWTNYRSNGIMNNDYIKGCLEWDKDTWLLGGDFNCFFNHRTGTFEKGFDLDKVFYANSFCRDANNNVWFASRIKGLILLSLSNQLFSYTQLIPGYYPDKIFYYDEASGALTGMNIYFTSGIAKLQLNSGEIIRDSIREFKPLKSVLNNFLADKDILYLATEKGFWKYDLQTHSLDSVVFFYGSASSQKSYFFNLNKSGDNIYFTGKFATGGPFIYNTKNDRVIDLSLITGDGNHLVTSNYQPDYSPYQGIPHGQINKDDLPLIHQKQNEPTKYCFSMTIHNSVLYAGVNSSDSLYIYNEKNGIKKAIAIPPYYINGKPCNVLSLCVDHKENLWCGTVSNGVLVYNIPTAKWIKHIGQGEGYFPDLTSQLVADDDGLIWANTSEGLFSFNQTDFKFKRYGMNEGLGTESNIGTLIRLPRHRLLFNNVNKDHYSYTFGIITTRPPDTLIKRIPISVFGLKVMGKDFLPDTLLDNVQQLELPPLQNSFSLSYAGISLTQGKDLLYSYKLDDVETEWHYAGSEQSLSYLNLKPGTYRLHIACKTRDESLVGIEKILLIKILPAWYQQWWFKLLIGALIVIVIILAFRYYLRQQLKKQQLMLEKERALEAERQRIAADMHDDVGAGLSRIRYIANSMKEGLQLSTDDMDKILSLSDESVEKMNEIIWSLNQGNQQLSELMYHMRSQCAEMVHNANINFECELPEQIPDMILPWNLSRNIYLLVKEAVNNAIKHANATVIRIEIKTGSILEITVADNGIGFDAATLQRKGNGMLHFKKRTTDIHASVVVNSQPGKGTTIAFSIPL